MAHSLRIVVPISAILLLASGLGAAEPEHDRGARHQEIRPEPHSGPRGYQRVTEPPGWDVRPGNFNRADYQHNFQAARTYRIGPYHRPKGWKVHRWVFGEILPRTYWVSEYIIADYWLFGLEVPPAGFEWVRVGHDAILVSTVNGEILQTEINVFG